MYEQQNYLTVFYVHCAHSSCADITACSRCADCARRKYLRRTLLDSSRVGSKFVVIGGYARVLRGRPVAIIVVHNRVTVYLDYFIIYIRHQWKYLLSNFVVLSHVYFPGLRKKFNFFNPRLMFSICFPTRIILTGLLMFVP